MKQKNKIFILLLVTVFLISFVSAESFTLQFDDSVNYEFVCLDEQGNHCGSGTTCNINIQDPEGVNALRNSSMTYNETFFNVTLPTNKFGKYSSLIICQSSNFSKSEFIYTVTGDGEPFRQFPYQFLIALFGFLLIFVSFFFGRLRIFKHIGSIILLIIGVLTLYPGYSFINWTTLFGKSFGFSLIGLGFYFLLEDSFSEGRQEDYFND